MASVECSDDKAIIPYYSSNNTIIESNGRNYSTLKTSLTSSVQPSNLGPISESFTPESQTDHLNYNSDTLLNVRFVNSQNGADIPPFTSSINTIVYVKNVVNQVRVSGPLASTTDSTTNVYTSKSWQASSLDSLANANLVLEKVIPLTPNLTQQTAPTELTIPRNYELAFSITPFIISINYQNILRYTAPNSDGTSENTYYWFGNLMAISHAV